MWQCSSVFGCFIWMLHSLRLFVPYGCGSCFICSNSVSEVTFLPIYSCWPWAQSRPLQRCGEGEWSECVPSLTSPTWATNTCLYAVSLPNEVSKLDTNGWFESQCYTGTLKCLEPWYFAREKNKQKNKKPKQNKNLPSDAEVVCSPPVLLQPPDGASAVGCLWWYSHLVLAGSYHMVAPQQRHIPCGQGTVLNSDHRTLWSWSSAKRKWFRLATTSWRPREVWTKDGHQRRLQQRKHLTSFAVSCRCAIARGRACVRVASLHPTVQRAHWREGRWTWKGLRVSGDRGGGDGRREGGENECGSDGEAWSKVYGHAPWLLGH